MPPFVYSPYHNPYVQSISSLLEAPGQIEAQRAQTVGNAQANAALGSGQAWGQAVQSAAQAVGAIPQQMQAAKMQALQMKDIQAQVAERNAIAAQRDRDVKAQQAGEAAIRSAIDPATGKVDYEKAASAWEAAGFPTQANAYRESVQKTRQTAQALDEGQQKIEAGKRQAAQAQTDHLAELGASGLERLKTDDPVHARDYAMGLVANAVSHGLVSPDDAKQMLMRTASAGPDQLATIYQSLVDASPAVKDRLVKRGLEQAQTAKDLAAAEKDKNPPVKKPKEYEVEVPGPNGPVKKLVTAEQLRAGVQAYQKPPENPARGDDAKAIADAIIDGKQPPSVQGLYRLAGPVRAELAKQRYDMTTANLDWEATKKHLATLNGAQQTRLRQAISTAADSLDVIQNLADKWDAGRFPLLNKANLLLAKQGAYGKDAASIATQLEGQITDVTSELGNVYMGGNSPTDHALQLAGKNLSADWDRKVLTDMIKLARTNLQIRGNSIATAGAITSSNQQAAPAGNAKDPMGIR